MQDEQGHAAVAASVQHVVAGYDTPMLRYLVGSSQLLELGLCIRVPRILVRMNLWGAGCLSASYHSCRPSETRSSHRRASNIHVSCPISV